MGKKARTVYVCDSCGAQSPKWQGQCPDCGSWNTLAESLPVGLRALLSAAPAASRVLSEVGEEAAERRGSGIGELDRVLGGGLVPGSVVLIGGDPGIGKSTLLLQAAANLSMRTTALYVTGEESLGQVGLRARRLQLDMSRLQALAETRIEQILTETERVRPTVLIIDSIQTMFTDALQSAPGAVAQLRETTALLVRFAKNTNTSVFLVGHVTKDGAIAGPRVLEHMVDTVLYFQSDAGSRYRVVRAVKNRFGAANELGVFAMTDNGLKEVRNPSAIFLSRHETEVPGSVVTVASEGSRPLLVEVQGLVDDARGAHPRRIAVGFDTQRLNLLLAVLHRHGGVAIADHDVFVNVVGGVRITETAADLPALLAALSSFRNRALPGKLVVFGEIGLAGEIRPVPFGEERLRAAVQYGFKRAIVPDANTPKKPIDGIEVIPVKRVSDALDAAF